MKRKTTVERNETAFDRVERDCPVAGVLAARLRVARETITQRWLERIAARVTMDPQQIFPTEELLDHVPVLIDGIADYLEDPGEVVAADAPVVAKAMELGELRHEQGFDPYEILKEFEILGGILYRFLSEVIETIDVPCSRGELLTCAHRVFRAISVIQQATTSHYLRRAGESIHDREQRLRAFNRALSHEFKNRIGAVLGASELLAESDGFDVEQMERMRGILRRNAREMERIIRNLLDLSRLERDARQQKHIELRQAAVEATRQLREIAEENDVRVRVSDGLPPVEVNAAAVELCLTNYISNAIKYSDPDETERCVEVTGEVVAEKSDGPCAIVVRVQDNGKGVAEEKRAQLFERFFRAHEGDTSVTGTGLGLSIVRETVESLGGRAWAEFPGKGSVFAFSLPCRRAEDRQQERASEAA
jgi:signal transduction histidine kinase